MRLETLILVIAALAPFLPAWAWPRVLRDPASFDPFDGEAARWRRGRGEPEPEFVPEPEELPRIPPGMSDDEFEAWLNAPEPGETAEVVAREMSEDGKLLFTPRGARPPVDADEWEKYSRR